MVGAPGFEPGTSCAQGRRNASHNSRRFNPSSENTVVNPVFGMCGDVLGCGWMLVGSLQKPLHGLREVGA
jgi:hypothetical protein